MKRQRRGKEERAEKVDSRLEKPEKVIESEEREERGFLSREKMSVFGDQIQFEELLKPSRRKESTDLFVLKTPFLYQDFRDIDGVR